MPLLSSSSMSQSRSSVPARNNRSRTAFGRIGAELECIDNDYRGMQQQQDSRGNASLGEAGLLPDRRLWSGEGHRSSEDEDSSDVSADASCFACNVLVGRARAKSDFLKKSQNAELDHDRLGRQVAMVLVRWSFKRLQMCVWVSLILGVLILIAGSRSNLIYYLFKASGAKHNFHALSLELGVYYLISVSQPCD